MADPLCPCSPSYYITGPCKIPAVLICQPVCVAARPDIAAIKAIIAVIVYHTRNVIIHSDVIAVDNDVVQLVRSIFRGIVTSSLLNEHDRVCIAYQDVPIDLPGEAATRIPAFPQPDARWAPPFSTIRLFRMTAL